MHGNLPALEAVLQHIGDDYDLIIHLGDAIDNYDNYFVNDIPNKAWLRDAPEKRHHLDMNTTVSPHLSN